MPKHQLIGTEIIKGPNINDIQIVKTWRDWIRMRHEFEQTELLEIEIANQQKYISDLETNWEQQFGQKPTELSVCFSDDADELAYPIALFRQLGRCEH